MKKIIPRISLLVAAILFSLSLFAQEPLKKQSARELAEKGSRGDVIIGKREQKKSLEAPPVKIHKADSVAPLPKKSAPKTVKRSKKNKPS